MKKMIAMLAAALLLFSLAGCGDKKADSTGANGASNAGQAASVSCTADDTGLFEDSTGVVQLAVGYMENGKNVAVGKAKLPVGGSLVAYGYNAKGENTVLANGDTVAAYLEAGAEEGAVMSSIYMNTAKAEVYLDVVPNGGKSAVEMLDEVRAQAFLLTELNAGIYGAVGSFTAESEGVSVYSVTLPLNDDYSVSIRCMGTELYDALGAEELGSRLCNLFLPA